MALYDESIDIKAPPDMIWQEAHKIASRGRIIFEEPNRLLIATATGLGYVYLLEERADGSTRLRHVVESASNVRDLEGEQDPWDALDALASRTDTTGRAVLGVGSSIALGGSSSLGEQAMTQIKKRAERTARMAKWTPQPVAAEPAPVPEAEGPTETRPRPATRDVQKLEKAAFQSILVKSTPRVFITPIILGLAVLIFVVMLLSGVSLFAPQVEDLIKWGANFGPYTLNQEWWRLLSSVSIHIGVLHLLFNMQCLWNLGNLAERLFGNWTFLLLYLVSGIGGSIASLWWNPTVVSAGASGAIFGVAGGIAMFFLRGKLSVPPSVIRKNLNSILVFVGYNLLYGFGASGINNAAHLGGLATGLVAGALLLRPLPPLKDRSRLWNHLAVFGVALALILSLGFVKQQVNDPLVQLTMAEDLLTAGDFDQAITEIEQVLESDPDLALAHLMLGYAYKNKESYDESIACFTRAIALDPEYAEAYLNRALAYAMTGGYDQVLTDLNKAIDIGLPNPNMTAFAHFLRGVLYADMGEREKAVPDLEKALELGLEPSLEQNAQALLEELGQ